MAEPFGWSHGALLCGPDAGETPAVPGEAACREPQYAGSAGILPALGKPRRIKKPRYFVVGPDAGETPALPRRRRSQGEVSKHGFTLPRELRVVVIFEVIPSQQSAIIRYYIGV